MNRILLPLLLALSVICTASPASAKLIERIVATVNDDIITLSDVRRAATPFLLQNGMRPDALDDPKRKDEILRQVLEELIDRKLILIQARKIDLKIADAEVDQWIAFTRQQRKMSDEQFKAIVAQYGMDYEDYRDMIRQNLLKIRMIKIKVGSQVAVTDADVNTIYETKFGPLGAAEKFVTVSHILVRPKDMSPPELAAARLRADKVRARIVAGEKLADLAKTESDGPSASNQGRLGTFRKGDLDPDFERATFSLKVGEPSKVVKTKFGFHVIEVTAIEERPSPDVQDRLDTIRAQLHEEQLGKLLASYMKTLRDRSFVAVKL